MNRRTKIAWLFLPVCCATHCCCLFYFSFIFCLFFSFRFYYCCWCLWLWARLGTHVFVYANAMYERSVYSIPCLRISLVLYSSCFIYIFFFVPSSLLTNDLLRCFFISVALRSAFAGHPAHITLCCVCMHTRPHRRFCVLAERARMVCMHACMCLCVACFCCLPHEPCAWMPLGAYAMRVHTTIKIKNQQFCKCII